MRCVDIEVASRVCSLGQLCTEGPEIEAVRGNLADHPPSRSDARRHDRNAVLDIETGKVCRCRRGQRVERQQHADLAGRRITERHRRYNRTGLLRQPRLVGGLGIDSRDLRSSSQHLADRDHAGATDAGHADGDVVGHDESGRGQFARGGSDPLRLLRLARLHRDERRAITLQATGIDVAAGLIDHRLATELGLGGMQRQAVGLHATVAAGLADPLVDHHSERGRGDDPALAIATLLGSALLVVDVHGDTVHATELHLCVDDGVAMDHVDTTRKIDAAVFAGIVSGDRDVLDTFGHEHPGHLRNAAQTGGVLPSRHRHGGVVQDLERHGRAGSDGRLNGQLTAVEVRAVAHVLEEVVIFDKWRGADPLSTFATHLRDAGDMTGLLARDDADHPVTTDACADQRSFWYEQPGVVRAAGTEERRSDSFSAERDPHRLGLADDGQLIDRDPQREDSPQRFDEVVRRQRAVVGDQRLAVVVQLANDGRRIGRAVQHRPNT